MSELILNPGIQDVVFNSNSSSLYYNQEKIWPVVKSNFTLLFSSASPVSSGTLSSNTSNYDEIFVVHGLTCSDTKCCTYNIPGQQVSIYNVVFDSTNQRFVKYGARYTVSGTSFSITGSPHCNYHGKSSGTWTNDTSSYRNNHIYEIWGVKYA